MLSQSQDTSQSQAIEISQSQAVESSQSQSVEPSTPYNEPGLNTILDAQTTQTQQDSEFLLENENQNENQMTSQSQEVDTTEIPVTLNNSSSNYVQNSMFNVSSTSDHVLFLHNSFKTYICLWFWFCLYSEKQIADRFEQNVSILKKRTAQVTYLNNIAKCYGFTYDYLLSLIRSTLPTLIPGCNTLSLLKTSIESGKFAYVSKSTVESEMENFQHKSNNLVGTMGIDSRIACPDFAYDFISIVIDPAANPTTDPFSDSYNSNPVPSDINKAVSSASFSGTALLIAVGGALLFSLFSKKK